MKKNYLSVVFDRKKKVKVTGIGKVEIHVYKGRNQRKYISLRDCNELEWRHFSSSQALKDEVAIYENIVANMIKNGEELTIEMFNTHTGIQFVEEKNEVKQKRLAKTGFIDFLRESIEKEHMAAGTIRRKKVVLEAVIRYGKIKKFSDLTELNIRNFDEFLRSETERTDVTLNNYHKEMRKYIKLAFQLGYVDKNPYESPLCHFGKGKSKERKPLNEDELVALRKLNLSGKEDRVRDLFVFCAYTGLSYIDSQAFDYENMTETINGKSFINGERIKTGNTFFTPILSPAMQILRKYDFKVPHISNQKANEYLHLVESRMNINKPMTMHVERHSFATLCLTYDVSLDKVQRMMGHSDIKTTQIYAKILKSSIERHSESLSIRIK